MKLSDQDIRKYLKDLRKCPVMTSEREKLLSEKMKSPLTTEIERKKIKDEMVEGNLRLVLTVAKRYQNQGILIEDLIAEGNMGLLKAIENFDWSKNIKFISYADWWVRQSIIQALNDHSRTIRIPTNIINEQRKARKEYDELKAFDSLSNNARLAPITVRIEESTGDSDFSLLDVIENKDSLKPDYHLTDEDIVKQRLMTLLNILTERERVIIQDYFGLFGATKNLEDIGNDFDLTRERVRQIKEKALRRLRDQSYEFFHDK